MSARRPPADGRRTQSGGKMAFAGQMACLSPLAPYRLEQLSRSAASRSFAKGAVLVREGEPGEGVFYVLRGRLKLHRLVASGRTRTVRVLNPGDCHCISPVHRGMVSPLTLECATDAEVILLRGDRVAHLLGSDPGACGGAIRCLAGRLSESIREGSEHPVRSVRQRVAEALVLLSAAARQRPDGRVILDGFSHEEIAAFAGTVREVASRALASLETAGILERGRGRISILDPRRLEAASGRPAG